VWLLDVLGHTRQNAALAGDLLEEYADGRSAAWYWRQTLLVMLHGVARNARVFQRYYQAVLIGFAAQSAVAAALWWVHVPRQVHGVWWFIAGGALVLSVFVALAAVQERVTGRRHANLQLLSSAVDGGSPDRKAILTMVAAETFVTYLLSYSLWTFFLPRPSGSELLFVQVEWLVLFAITPALVLFPVAREVPAVKVPAAETARPERLIYPSQEISLLIARQDGGPILLRPDNAVTSILGRVNEELAAQLFPRAVSVEQLRQAIWLGSSRNYLAMLKNDLSTPPVASLADFAALLQEVTRPAVKDTFWKRTCRRFQ
jgi:hypothetical protein